MIDSMIGESFGILSDFSSPSLFEELRPEVASVFHGNGSDALGVAVGSEEEDGHFRVTRMPLKSDRFKSPSQRGLAVGVSYLLGWHIIRP